MSLPVVYDGRLYVLYDRGTLACFDARTGKEIYGPQRLEGQFTASPVAADGKVYCLSESGETFVLRAGDEFKVLSRNRLGETTQATPAITGDAFLVRTLTKLYAIAPAEPAPPQ